ncbi:hypothetical protein Tco_1062685 [Tanacetum coccineum]
MIPKTKRLQKYKKLHVVFYGLECGLEVGSIRRIQGIGYGVLEFLGVGTTFDIFQNIHILYLQYGVLTSSGYDVLIFFPLWSLVSAGTDSEYGAVESDEAEECDEVILVSDGSEASNSFVSKGASSGSDSVSIVAGV